LTPAFAAAFDLTDGDLGAMYGGATLLSAVTLTWAGRLIDRTTVRRYTWVAAALLAGVCLLTAIATFGLMLAVFLFSAHRRARADDAYRADIDGAALPERRGQSESSSPAR